MPSRRAPRHVLYRVLRRVAVELISVIVTATRFFTAVSGLLFGLAYVIISEFAGAVVRFSRAALVRSHYQPRSSLDSAMRLLREARTARTRTSANAAVLEAERLIHEATLCPLETSAVDLVTHRVLARQNEDEDDADAPPTTPVRVRAAATTTTTTSAPSRSRTS
jgi:hypothetical protein